MTTLAPVQEAINEVSTVIDPSCWDQTVAVASDVGNWISDAAVHTAVWIKDAAVWLAEGAVIVWDFVCDIAIKIYTFIAPYFVAFGEWVADTAVAAYNWVVDFVNKYPVETIVGAIALVVGAVFALLIERLCWLCCSSSGVDSRLIIPEVILGDETAVWARTLGTELQALGSNPTDAQVKAVVVRILTEETQRPADVAAAAAHIDAYWNNGMTNAFNLISFFKDQEYEREEALPDSVKNGLNAVVGLPANTDLAAIEQTLIDAMGIALAQQNDVRAAIQALPIATTTSVAFAKAAYEAQILNLGEIAAAPIAQGADRFAAADAIMQEMEIPNERRVHVRVAIVSANTEHLAVAQIPAAIALAAFNKNAEIGQRIKEGRDAAQRAAFDAPRNVVVELVIDAMQIDQAAHPVVRQALTALAPHEATPAGFAEAAFNALPAPAYQGPDLLIERGRIAAAVAQAVAGNTRAQVAQAMVAALNIAAEHQLAVTQAIAAVAEGATPQNLATAAVNAYRAAQAAAAQAAAQAAAAAAQAAAAQRQELIDRARNAVGTVAAPAPGSPPQQIRDLLATHMITAMQIVEQQRADAVRTAINAAAADATAEQLAEAAVNAIQAA